jgi:hypothetical protein
MWSFGEIHGEGLNVPGWGGTSNGWVDATFNLDAYVGKEVIIRFAFASDLAYDTQNEEGLLGVKIDNISLGEFYADFNDGEEGEMQYTSLLPVGGDLWHIGVPTDTPPSPVNAVLCQNDAGSYNGNMLNYLVSPDITLPSGGDIRADFMFRGNIHGDDAKFPNCDYWGWEISPNEGKDWFAMSNPYGKPDGKNYVYIDAPEIWYSVVNAYSGLDGDISEYAGETVRFRIYLKSTNHTPSLEGVMVDDFVIYHSQYLPTPSDLVAEADGREVFLTWEAPSSGGSEGWIHWDSGNNNDAVGSKEVGGLMEVSARFTADDLSSYVGGYITRINFFPNELNSTYTIKVWTGPAGNVVSASKAISNVKDGEWNEVILDNPLMIEFGVDYWIGYAVEYLPGQYPAGNDEGPRVAGKGDMIRFGNAWSSLYDATGGAINANWNVQALVEILGVPRTLNTRDLTGFNIYHSTASGSGYQLIDTVGDSTTEYIHTSPALGTTNYYVVTSIYEDGESEYSNEASAFVMSPNAYEHYYDDGTSETGYNAGHNNQVAVRFIPEINDPAHLTHIKIWVSSKKTGGMVIKIFPDANGMPAPQQTSQFIYAAANIKEGWNTITVQPDNPIYLASSPFYVAIQETNTSSAGGLDQDNKGSSLTKIGNNPGGKLNIGNLMIRVILDGNTDVEQVLTPAPQRLTANNYPNPFNPETTIQLSIPTTSEVNLSVYNLKGQLVKTLANGQLAAGNHSYTWDGKDQNGVNVSSGIYFYKVESDTQTINKRMILLK